MKNVLILILFLAAIAGNAIAQPNPQHAQAVKDKMAPFLGWAGKWKGQGSIMMQGGEKRTSNVDESIQAKLDNTLITMEGLGKYTDATGKEIVAHNAFAVLTYDPNTSQYKMRTFTKEGRYTDAWFNAISENVYQWGFDTPMGKTRYNITIDPAKKTWLETGEFSRDGNTWRPFFEMSLTKAD